MSKPEPERCASCAAHEDREANTRAVHDEREANIRAALSVASHADRTANVVAVRADIDRDSAAAITALNALVAAEQDRARVALAAADAKAEATRLAQSKAIVDELHAALRETCTEGADYRAIAQRFAAAWVHACGRASHELGAVLYDRHLAVPFFEQAIALNRDVVLVASLTNDHTGRLISSVRALHLACLSGHVVAVTRALEDLVLAVHNATQSLTHTITAHALDVSATRYETWKAFALQRDVVLAIAELDRTETEEARSKLLRDYIPNIPARIDGSIVVGGVPGDIEPPHANRNSPTAES